MDAVHAAKAFVLKAGMAGYAPARHLKKLWENIRNIHGLRLSEKINKGFFSSAVPGVHPREPAWIMRTGCHFVAISRQALWSLPGSGFQLIAAIALLKLYRLKRYLSCVAEELRPFHTVNLLIYRLYKN
jgi:hypothetical protein